MLAALDVFGDPLHIHGPGREARGVLDTSRSTVAEAIGAQPDELVFTSGGTESVALGIWGAVRAVRELGNRIVVSAWSIPSVGGVCYVLESDGFEVVIVPVDEFGRVDLDAFAAEVRRPGTLLASIQHANHELGTMQQIGEASRLAREAKVLFHTDACQTLGRLPVDVGGPRRRPALVLGAQVRRAGRASGAVRAARRRDHRLPVRRRPRAQAAQRDGEHPRHRRHGGRAHGLARRHGRPGGATVGADGEAPRADRTHGARLPRARAPTHRTPHLLCFPWKGWTRRR